MNITNNACEEVSYLDIPAGAKLLFDQISELRYADPVQVLLCILIDQHREQTVNAVQCDNPIALIADMNAFQHPHQFSDLAARFPGVPLIVKRPGSGITFVGSKEETMKKIDQAHALDLYARNLIDKESALQLINGSGSDESATGADSSGNPRTTQE